MYWHRHVYETPIERLVSSDRSVFGFGYECVNEAWIAGIRNLVHLVELAQ